MIILALTAGKIEVRNFGNDKKLHGKQTRRNLKTGTGAYDFYLFVIIFLNFFDYI